MPRPAPALASLLLCALGTQAATPAADATPSAASVQELLAVSGMHAILDNMATQYRAAIKKSMQKSYEGKNLNEEQQKIESDAEDKAVDILSRLLSWDTLSPVVVEVFSSTYTQAEIDGLNKFYSSPIGKALTAKQPVAMQKTMAQMQSKVGEIMPELKQLALDTAQQLRAAATPAAPAPAPAP
jgi:uncharacterized protein